MTPDESEVVRSQRAEEADPSRPERRPQVRSACGWLDAPTRLEVEMDERG